MAALDPIDDTNTFPDKDDGGTAQTVETVNADDLNSLKDRIAENRTQANLALASTAGAVTARTASFSLAAADHGALQTVDASAGAVVVTVPHTLWGSVYGSGQFKARVLVTNADNAVTLVGSGGIALTYFGPNTVKTGDLITITVVSATSALIEIQPWGNDLLPLDGGTVTAATRTLTVADAAQIIGLDPTSNTIAVTIPHTLFWAGGTGRTFQCTLVALNVANAITFAGSGGLGLTYYGDSTIAAGDIIRISVESATVCRVDITHTGAISGPSSGTDGALLIWDGAGARLVADSGLLAIDVITGISDADTKAADALYPLVQSAHTSATKTLAAGDAGDVIPMNGASNAIAVTIPHTLFAAGGTGRAFVCQIKVVSVAGGALTFAGSGGIALTYYGKDPGTDAYIAGDWITIVVDSATTASIFAVEAL